MFGEPEVPDTHHDIEPVARSLDLPRLRARRTVHAPPKGARRVATAEAKVGHVRRAGQELDRLGPHAVAVLQRGTTVQTVGDFGAIAQVGQRPERARRLHRQLLSPPAPPPHGLPRAGAAGRAGQSAALTPVLPALPPLVISSVCPTCIRAPYMHWTP